MVLEATFIATAATCKTPADRQRRPWQVQVQQRQRQSRMDISGSHKGSDKFQVSMAALSRLANTRAVEATLHYRRATPARYLKCQHTPVKALRLRRLRQPVQGDMDDPAYQQKCFRLLQQCMQ